MILIVALMEAMQSTCCSLDRVWPGMQLWEHCSVGRLHSTHTACIRLCADRDACKASAPGVQNPQWRRTLMMTRHCVSNSPNCGGSSFCCLPALRLPGGFAARSAARFRLASVVACAEPSAVLSDWGLSSTACALGGLGAPHGLQRFCCGAKAVAATKAHQANFKCAARGEYAKVLCDHSQHEC